MSWLSRNWGRLARGVLGFIPGGGAIAAAVDLAEGVADAIGGDAGRKIKAGVRAIGEGMEQIDRERLTPELRAALEEARLAHAERMRELGLAEARLELADVQGGRDLARAEIASSDAYVRRTRPLLLRIYGVASILLVLATVGSAFAAVFFGDLSPSEAGFLAEVVSWALGAILGAFVMMYRAYTGRRTEEKLAEVGMRPEGLVDKLVRLKGER